MTGSVTLVHGLIAAGLVDEYRLFVYPVVVGHGRPSFDRARYVPAPRLVASETYRSGVVFLCYRPAGPRADG